MTSRTLYSAGLTAQDGTVASEVVMPLRFAAAPFILRATEPA